MKEVLLFYSGGLDSKLAAIYLIFKGYHVNLIHFDNGSSIGTERIVEGFKELEQRFGSDKISYLGIVSTFGMMKRFSKINNLKFSTMIEKYGNTTISQYQCLPCRSAMYYYGALIALEKGISIVATGSRKSQQFAIEQPQMIEEYRRFLNHLGLELLTPVYDLVDDYERKLESGDLNLLTSPYESQCLLGYHIEEEYPVDEEAVRGIVKIFQETILPEMHRLIQTESEKQRIKYLEYYEKKIEWY